MKLTDNEKAVLIGSTRSEYGDSRETTIWSFSACACSGLEEKVYRGAVSSLVKKDLVSIYDNEDKGRSNDMVFGLTDEGKVEVNKLLTTLNNFKRDLEKPE